MDKIATSAIVFMTFIAPAGNQNGLTPSLQPTPPASVQAAQTQNLFKNYTVEAGDTFDSIARLNYGSGKYWTTLWNHNPGVDNPAQINAGDILKIRSNKPISVDDLTPELGAKYEALHPSPTPTPTGSPVPQGQPSNFDGAYQAAGSRFGVPWQILYGIHLTETGLRDGAITSGYGSGAQGPMQFLPQTFNSYAIDGNGDGTLDINNAIDAIYTAAHFIQAHGSVDAALRAYGGDAQSILNAARSRSYSG